ncbi:hypothetical protein [Rugosimonospora africana]|uniref:Uncharacterized protein n=1 Tax=Rugosimonospora africana TaxID=556532 RepID=A0A8J3VWM0_9ACTN|nr:hypothetical protein [Rugosimonospora africana]GIH20923.1 hypothetical protein Raf01_90950 [Rugosimonospora africana]
MERRRRHWWNGKWGRIARRDVFLSLDDGTGLWWVEAREGGAEGRQVRQEFDCEPDALRRIRRLTEGSPIDNWREMPAG